MKKNLSAEVQQQGTDERLNDTLLQNIINAAFLGLLSKDAIDACCGGVLSTTAVTCKFTEEKRDGCSCVEVLGMLRMSMQMTIRIVDHYHSTRNA